MGFEVLTVVRIRNVVWFRTPYSLVHTWLWTFWRSILDLSTQAIMMAAVGPGQIVCADHLYCRVHKWEDRNFESEHYTFFMHCVTLLQNLCTHVRQYIALLFYSILWSEQKCVAGNTRIITNSSIQFILRSSDPRGVCCLMNVRSCFVKVLMFFFIFSTVTRTRKRCGYGMAVGCFTDVVLDSSKNYHREHATEPCRLQVTPSWPHGPL
jgi:hypothetical protein